MIAAAGDIEITRAGTGRDGPASARLAEGGGRIAKHDPAAAQGQHGITIEIDVCREAERVDRLAGGDRLGGVSEVDVRNPGGSQRRAAGGGARPRQRQDVAQAVGGRKLGAGIAGRLHRRPAAEGREADVEAGISAEGAVGPEGEHPAVALRERRGCQAHGLATAWREREEVTAGDGDVADRLAGRSRGVADDLEVAAAEVERREGVELVVVLLGVIEREAAVDLATRLHGDRAAEGVGISREAEVAGPGDLEGAETGERVGQVGDARADRVVGRERAAEVDRDSAAAAERAGRRGAGDRPGRRVVAELERAGVDDRLAGVARGGEEHHRAGAELVDAAGGTAGDALGGEGHADGQVGTAVAGRLGDVEVLHALEVDAARAVHHRGAVAGDGDGGGAGRDVREEDVVGGQGSVARPDGAIVQRNVADPAVHGGVHQQGARIGRQDAAGIERRSVAPDEDVRRAEFQGGGVADSHARDATERVRDAERAAGDFGCPGERAGGGERERAAAALGEAARARDAAGERDRLRGDAVSGVEGVEGAR